MKGSRAFVVVNPVEEVDQVLDLCKDLLLQRLGVTDKVRV